MKKPFVWFEIHIVAQYASTVLAKEHPSLYVMRPHGILLPYSIAAPTPLGTLLWNQAMESLGALHTHPATRDQQHAYGRYEYVEPTKPPVDALAMLFHCAQIETHSNGASNYYTTTAWHVLHALERRAMRRLPGWDLLPWSSSDSAGRSIASR